MEKQETYIGNIDTGKSGNVDLLAKAVMVTDFEEMAKPEDWIIVTYEDRNGNKHEEKVDVSFYIETVDYEDRTCHMADSPDLRLRACSRCIRGCNY